jgi:lysine 2,3-aminomutase
MKTDSAHQKRHLSKVSDLVAAGLVHPSDTEPLKQVSANFAIGLTDHIAALSQTSAAVARQYVPQTYELATSSAELDDPIGDDVHSPIKGIVHRYPDRVLLKIAQACAVYCRYCFRREMIGPGTGIMSAEDIEAALSYIRQNTAIEEVILTGGDPLILSPRQLEPVLKNLAAMDHIGFIRIHTRILAADPLRITDALCQALNQPKSLYIALHINHADEITDSVRDAIVKLRCAGCILLSQSVLLRGVNDNPETLEILFRTFLKLGIKPYYIHHPDKARGTAHFRLPLQEGMNIIRQLQGRLSGLAQPHYMLDIPKGFGKVPVHEGFIKTLSQGSYEITDYQGQKHLYDDD